MGEMQAEDATSFRKECEEDRASPASGASFISEVFS